MLSIGLAKNIAFSLRARLKNLFASFQGHPAFILDNPLNINLISIERVFCSLDCCQEIYKRALKKFLKHGFSRIGTRISADILVGEIRVNPSVICVYPR